MTLLRTRWAALGAAVAITLGTGGISLVSATEPADAATLISITPCRILDTRPEFNVGPKASPLGPGETHTVLAHGDNGNCTDIPADAVALSMNMTAVGATADTFLTVWAAGSSQPLASSLNPSPGAAPTPNAVTSGLSSDGAFSIFNLAGNVHVLADINGYYVDHTHDDRYYTEDEVDTALGGKADQSALDARVPRTGQLNVWFDEFTSARSEDDLLRGSSNNNDGVTFLSGTAGGGAQMGAPVQLPDGASITNMVAYLWDNSTTASNRLEVVFSCHHIPTGPATASAIDSDDRLRIATTASGNTAPSTFAPFTMTPFGGAPDPIVVDTDECAYGLRIQTSPNTWNTEPNGSFKVLGVTIEYSLPE